MDLDYCAVADVKHCNISAESGCKLNICHLKQHDAPDFKYDTIRTASDCQLRDRRLKQCCVSKFKWNIIKSGSVHNLRDRHHEQLVFFSFKQLRDRAYYFPAVSNQHDKFCPVSDACVDHFLA